MKKRTIEYVLENEKENLKIIDAAIALNLEYLFKLIEIGNDEVLKNNIIFDEDINEIETNLIKVETYIKNEIIVLNTNLIPMNYFTLESYKNNSNIKNIIIKAVSTKIKEINLEENSWRESIIFFEFFKDGRKSDLDNYFFKPFVDGIVLSGIIENDFMENLKIIYSRKPKDKHLLKITLINKKSLGNYKEKIFKILES